MRGRLANHKTADVQVSDGLCGSLLPRRGAYPRERGDSGGGATEGGGVSRSDSDVS